MKNKSAVDIHTRFRRIASSIPHPESAAVMKRLEEIEPRSMSGFSEILWDRAEGFQVHDAYGNMWIDFTSAIILANAGHAHPHIRSAVVKQMDAGLWHAYCNPTKARLTAVEKMKEILPGHLEKVFLLTTGSEAIECAIKLARMHGRRIDGDKYHIVSYFNSFHGRTMGSQTAGGYLDQQEWMGEPPPGFHHIPFPDCSFCPWGKKSYDQCGAECLERSISTLRDQGLEEKRIAGVLTETFQGPTVAFMPADYVRALRLWADTNKALLVFDEVQAGFGRTGKWFGFEHYGVEADLICLGKGMTSSLPMSAVAGRRDIMDIPTHGEMSSTHTGNPLCCAALAANIEVIQQEKLLEHAQSLGRVIDERTKELSARCKPYVGNINGKGLAWGIYLTSPDVEELDKELAHRVTELCIQKGILMFQTNRGTLKIAPPLCIPEDAMLEGLDVLEESLLESVRRR